MIKSIRVVMHPRLDEKSRLFLQLLSQRGQSQAVFTDQINGQLHDACFTSPTSLIAVRCSEPRCHMTFQGMVAPGAAGRSVDFFSEVPGSGTWRISGSSYFSRDGSGGFSPGFILLTIRGVMTNTSSVSWFLKRVLLKSAPKIGMSPKSGNLVRSLRI